MSSSASLLSTVRIVVFVAAILFSLIVIALSANIIALTEPLFYYKFSALSLSTGLLTILTLIPMFIIDMACQGSFFSYIVVEISWLSVLWILWLSSGSYAVWTDVQIIDNFPDELSCSFQFLGDAGDVRGCEEIKTIWACSFFLCILLMAYTITLLVLAIRAQGRGNPAWTTGVRASDGVLFYSVGKGMGGGGLIQPALVAIPVSQPQPQQYIVYANPQYTAQPVVYANPQYTTPQPVVYTNRQPQA